MHHRPARNRTQGREGCGLELGSEQGCRDTTCRSKHRRTMPQRFHEARRCARQWWHLLKPVCKGLALPVAVVPILIFISWYYRRLGGPDCTACKSSRAKRCELPTPGHVHHQSHSSAGSLILSGNQARISQLWCSRLPCLIKARTWVACSARI